MPPTAALDHKRDAHPCRHRDDSAPIFTRRVPWPHAPDLRAPQKARHCGRPSARKCRRFQARPECSARCPVAPAGRRGCSMTELFFRKHFEKPGGKGGLAASLSEVRDVPFSRVSGQRESPPSCQRVRQPHVCACTRAAVRSAPPFSPNPRPAGQVDGRGWRRTPDRWARCARDANGRRGSAQPGWPADKMPRRPESDNVLHPGLDLFGSWQRVRLGRVVNRNVKDEAGLADRLRQRARLLASTGIPLIIELGGDQAECLV